MFDVGAEDAQGENAMAETDKHGSTFGVPHTKRRASAAETPASLVGRDVEIRAVGGAIVRGRLSAERAGWLTVENHVGRTAVVRTDSVCTIVAESGMRAEGRPDPEYHVGTPTAEGDA